MIIPNVWENKKCSKPPTSKAGWSYLWILAKIAWRERGILELVLPIQSNSLRWGVCQDLSNHFKHDYDNADC